MSPPPLAERLEAARTRIATACRTAGRAPNEVTLLAASKRQSDELIAAYAALGVTDFGENQVQSWQGRLERLGDLDLRWHLIGMLQTNKAKHVAKHPPVMIHTIDRVPLVNALRTRLDPQARVDCLIEVNIDREAQKAGCDPLAIDVLADKVAEAPNLVLRGLMCIPRPRADGPPTAAFARTRELVERIGDRVKGTPVLSMGMSGDFEAAIAEGSTMVRLGTALFGGR